MLLLVFVAIRMLANIEATFNDIWGVTRGRNWLWRIVLYWTTITLGPIALAGALGLAGGPHLQSAENLVTRMPFIGGLIFQFLPLAGPVVDVCADLSARAEHQGSVQRGVCRRRRRRLAVAFEQYLRLPLRFARGQQQQDLRQPRPRAGVHDRTLFFLADPAVRRPGRLRLPKPQGLSAGQAGRKREPARTRIHRAPADDVHRPAFSTWACRRSRSRKSPPSWAFPPSWCNRFCRRSSPRGWSSKSPAPRPPTSPRARWTPSTPTTFCTPCATGGGQEPPLRDEPVRAEVYGEFARIEEAERQAAASDHDAGTGQSRPHPARNRRAAAGSAKRHARRRQESPA